MGEEIDGKSLKGKRERAAPSMEALRNRLRGLAILVAIAALGLGLSALNHLDRPESLTVVIEGERGETILLMGDKDHGNHPEIPPDTRLFLSKVPFIIDRYRWTIELPCGTWRLVPGDWHTVLVTGDGHLEPHPFQLHPSHFQEIIIRTKRDGFPGALQALRNFDPGLASFFD